MRYLTLGYLTLNDGPIETLVAAAEAGFRSVGIRISGRRVGEPYAHVIGNRTRILEITARASDYGVRISNVSSYHLFPDVDIDLMKSVVDATAELGAKILVAHAHAPIEGRLIELFARYTEYAAKSNIYVAVEFQRYTYARNLEAATRWLEAAGQANAGYLFDPLHVDRAGHSMSDLLTVSPDRIILVQICDARKRYDNPSNEELVIEARTERLDPGLGELPLYLYLDSLPPDIEIEYEVPSPEYARLPVDERARLAADRFHRFIATYERARGRPDPWPGITGTSDVRPSRGRELA
jgi:sugar phosphate isomerase/epimerase